MPPLQLMSLLHTSLPHVSVRGRALLSALACVNGRPESSTELAHWLGFHDRYQLARAFKREGLPPMETLGGWTRTLYWVIESQSTGATLRELARRENLDPAVAYKLVRRVTGRRWSEIRRDALTDTALSFRDHCANSTPAHHYRRSRLHNEDIAASCTASTVAVARNVPPAAAPRTRLRGVLGERVPMEGAPFDVAITGTHAALVTRGHAAAVDVLALDQPGVLRTIPVGPVPTRVVPSLCGGWAYVTSQFSEAIDVVDLRAGRLAGEIQICGHPLGAVLSDDGQILYVATNRDRLVALALSRRAVLKEIAIPHGSPQICRHPSGRRVYASGWRSGVVAEIEVPTMHLLRTFEVGGIVQEVAVTPDGQSLYAANEAGWLNVIHLPTGKRRATCRFSSAALGLALSQDDTDVIVGLLHAGEVLILDRHSLDLRFKLQTGGTPRLIAAEPNGTVLVANEAGWVDFIQ